MYVTIVCVDRTTVLLLTGKLQKIICLWGNPWNKAGLMTGTGLATFTFIQMGNEHFSSEVNSFLGWS